MAETVQLVFEVRKETVDSAAKSLNDLKNKANAVSKSLEKLKSASGMKAIVDLNAKINKQSEQLAKLGIELNKTKTKLANVKSGFKDQVNSLKKSEKATKDQVKVLKAYNNAQGQVNKTHNVAIAAMGKAVQAADYYEETIKKLRAEIAKLRGEQEKGVNGVQKMDAAIRDANNSINKEAGLLARLSSSHKAQNQIRREGVVIQKQYAQQLSAVKIQLMGATTEEQRATLASQKDKIVTEQQIVAEKQHLAILAMKRANMKALTGTMNQFASTVRSVGMTMSRYLTTAMSAAIVTGVKMAANIEAQIVRFGILTGQMEKGARLYERIVEFSARTPFLLPDLGKASQILLAFGSPLENVMDELQRLGDLAMGDADKLERIVTSFGKVRSRGTAHMRELNRFIMSGVPIIQELNKNIGVTGEELFKMVERNEITFEHVEKAVKSLTNEGGRFHDMTMKVSTTLEGRFSTALDNLRINLASLFDPFVEDIKEILVKFIDWSQGFRALSEGARKEIAKLVGVLALIGPTLIALAGAVKIVTWAFTAFNFVINPLGATLRTIVALIAVITGSIVFDKLEESLNDAGEKAKKLAEYTEILNDMQEYSKDNIIPGLSEELFNVAKKYDLETEAIMRLVQAEELREKLSKGFEVDTKAVREAKRRYSEITNMASDAYMSLMKQSMPEQFGMLMDLQLYDTQEDYLKKQESARKQIVENLNRQIAEIKADMPFAEKIIDEFFPNDILDLTVDELYSLDFSKLKKSLDAAVKEEFPFTSKEEFMSDAAIKWRENLVQQIADLVSPEGLLEQEGITPENIKSDFYALLASSFSGIDEAFADYESGLSSTSTLINKYRNQQTQIMRALKRVRDSAVEEAINMGGAREKRGMRNPNSLIAKEIKAAEEVIDALDENIKALLRTRMSEIKSETEGTNLLRAMLGLTDDKDTIKVLENQIDGLIKLIQESTDFSYGQLLEMDKDDLPEIVDDIVKEIDGLKVKLDTQLRHKERVSLFEAFFEGDIKDTEIAMLESKIKESVDTLSTAIAGSAGDTESLTDVIFGHMREGTLNEFISGLDEASQNAFNTVSDLYARLQLLTEEAKNNTSLIQAFIGGEADFAEYMRQLNLDEAIRNFDTELQKHITDDRSATDILSILLGGEIPDDLQPLMPLLDVINKFKKEAEDIDPILSMFEQMGSVLKNSVTPAFKKLGESIALGATGMEAMGAAIGSIGQAIMDALPELLFNAGVNIIAGDPKNWMVGAGFIAASGVVAGLNGYLGASVAETKITETPASSISYSAKGDVFGNGYIARGPIGRSTNYGVSVIGEAGDEAVMPLTRGSGGKLGVAGMGGNVYVTVNNNTSSQVETKETTNSDGSKSIEFLVYDTVKKGLASGEFDRPMANSYGIARRGRY
jgi:tape measure domain-containing protein